MNYTIETLISQQDLEKKVQILADQINRDFKESRQLVCICLLKGSYAFFTDVVRQLKMTGVQVDFLQASSYGKNMNSSLTVEIKKDIEMDIKDWDVLLFDDIIDTGLTLEKVCRFLELKEPRSLKTCVLLDKPTKRLSHRDVDYVGFEIPDTFVVGYGIDYNENHRELPYIGQVIIK